MGDLKGKKTRRLPGEIKVKHKWPGLRTELVLNVVIMFVQGLPSLIRIAKPLGLYTYILFADGHGGSSVKLANAALHSALCERNFVPISIMSP